MIRSPYESTRTTGHTAGVANAPRTPQRTIRVPDDTWLAAHIIADRLDDNVASVLRAALKRYVKRHRRTYLTKTAGTGNALRHQGAEHYRKTDQLPA
jgi:hypothetical protein